MLLNVSILNLSKVLFDGQASRVIVPGEEGVFEVLPFHKRIMSRLITGAVIVNDQSIPIRRGVIKADQNKVTIILEEK
jgi:F-type H+-transporting ATPase subunit epsilon